MALAQPQKGDMRARYFYVSSALIRPLRLSRFGLKVQASENTTVVDVQIRHLRAASQLRDKLRAGFYEPNMEDMMENVDDLSTTIFLFPTDVTVRCERLI